MARRKNAPDAIRIKNGLSERLRQLRTEFYGERGGPDQARTLGIPVRTWYNYENGVTVPAEIILRVVELTSVEPIWLLRGDGPKFRNKNRNAGMEGAGSDTDCLAATPVKELLRVAIGKLEDQERSSADFSFGPPIVTRKEFEATPDQDQDQADWETEGQGDLHSLSVEMARLDSRKPLRHLRITDSSMAPIIAEDATVTYGEAEPVSELLHEKLVVAWIEGQTVVRWFQHCGDFGLLRAENPSTNPPSILVEFQRDDKREPQTFHRVLWISTPH
jgi:hypothetical protein